jgi:hypothetical protein
VHGSLAGMKCTHLLRLPLGAGFHIDEGLALTITLWLEVGNGLKLRESAGSEVCPLSTLKDLSEIVRDSDRVLTF